MAINDSDGTFQASYWRDAAGIGGDPDSVEYSDFLMELKDRIQKLLRQGRFAHAAIFQWNNQEWELVEEFERRDKSPGLG